jgi:hypothetical protein
LTATIAAAGSPFAHQVLRFYPDESVGYDYPQSYIKSFGADYRPDLYVEEDYKRLRNHKWYMSAG